MNGKIETVIVSVLYLCRGERKYQAVVLEST
ncbi:hypothetical protein ES703_12768 [subsurface metagenome]